MEVLLQASTTTPPSTSSSTNNRVSRQQKFSQKSSTTSLPTIIEIPEPPVEEASSPQKTGMCVMMHGYTYFGMSI